MSDKETIARTGATETTGRGFYEQGDQWPEVFPDFNQRIGGRTLTFHDFRGLSRANKRRVKLVMAEAWEMLAPEIMCQAAGTEEQAEKIVSDLSTSGAAAAVAEYRQRTSARLTEELFTGDTARPLVFGVTEGGEPVGAFSFYAINVLDTSPGAARVWMMPFPAFHRAPNAPLAAQMVLTADLCERALDFGPVTIRGRSVTVGEIRTLTYVNTRRQSRGDIECFLWNQEIDSRDGVSVQVLVNLLTPWGLELRRIRKLP